MTDPFKILDQIRRWPTQPGIYVMKDGPGNILYVGKAKNLRNRIKSYFQKGDVSAKTVVLVKKIASVEYTVTSNELEALLLECNLIKKHRPRYNVRLKDDKNYPYFVINFTHPFPRFQITRRVEVSPQSKYFGPYSAGVTELSRFLYKTFQLRDCSQTKFSNRARACLNYEIGTCTAPCVGYVSQEDYAKQVREAVLFLRGKKKELLGGFKRQMKKSSDKTNYEQARMIRDKIFAIEKITQTQNAVWAESRKDIDVIGCFAAENEIQWVILFIRSGFLTGRRSHCFRLSIETIEEATRTLLEQVYLSSLIPDEIWLSQDFPERQDLERLLGLRAKKDVHIRNKRGDKPMRLLQMASENAKLLYLESQKKEAVNPAVELQRVLGLAEPPFSIEGIDVSNTQAEAPAVSLIRFEEGCPVKSRYRLYYPKTVEGQNDFAMIHETVLRRFRDTKNPPPDLLLIDGGKGQLQAAVKAMEELEVNIPVCSLAKAKTESAFTLGKVEKTEERIFVPGRKNPILLRNGHPALRLLQQIRDQAHRFALKSHRRRREKHATETSSLLAIRGIGSKTKERLLKHFGNLERIRQASLEELISAGVSRPIASTLTAKK